ncbi:hypothetical protein LCGC14_0919830 [marine sediment metagenome]|uniref:SWIM-type domain-containing protein n=1 Tax=marine sediment metagenome TaxID=412755 RepID=A0A0F9RXS6_9ZZZZ
MLSDKKSRITSARHLLTRGRVNVAVANNLWVVQGDTNNYIVKQKALGPFVAECQCDDFKYNTADHNGYCKHIMAVALSESYHNDNSLEVLTVGPVVELSVGVYVWGESSLRKTFKLRKHSDFGQNAVFVDVKFANNITKRVAVTLNGEGRHQIVVKDETFI